MRKDDPAVADTVDQYIDDLSAAIGGPHAAGSSLFLNLPEGPVALGGHTSPFGIMRLRSGKHVVVRLGLVAYSGPLDTAQEAQDLIKRVNAKPEPNRQKAS